MHHPHHPLRPGPRAPCPLAAGAAFLGLGACALAAAALGCSEPPATTPRPSTGCSSDADCPTGTLCELDGLCHEPGGQAGSSGLDACEGSDDCNPEPPFPASVYWDGGEGAESVCTVPPGVCPGPAACRVATACLPPLSGADRPGSVRCELDEQCLSGRCLELSGVKSCLRSCLELEDCPFLGELPAGPFGGLTCTEVDDGGIPVRTCAPADAAHPERTLCRQACDCAGDDAACDPAAPGALACRFVPFPAGSTHALPVCDLPPPGGGVPTLGLCPVDPLACAGGRCAAGCINDGPADFCAQIPRRCTQPCNRDTDCPTRAACIPGADGQRVGSWIVRNQDLALPGREVRQCLVPTMGCYDEIDCCPAPDGLGGCGNGWTHDRGRCSVSLRVTGAAPHLVTICNTIDGRATPGSCCAAQADCDSDLCVPARPGTACAGGGVCSVPCDPAPDPDGLPGSGDEQDRCALFDFPSDYHRTSRCLPFDYPLPLPDGSTSPVLLNACQ